MRIPIVLRWSALVALAMLAPLGCGSDSKSPTDPGEDEPPKATSISLSASSLAFAALQDSSRLTATVKDQRGNTMAEASIDWASTDTTVAKVNASGWVFAVANGTVSVVATSGTLTDTAKVEIAQVPTTVALSPDTLELAPGDTARLDVVVHDANGFEIEDAAPTWSSGDTTVATVDESGLISGVAEGTAHVVASAGEAADTTVLVVAAGAGGGDGGGPGEGPGDDVVPATVEAAPALLEFDALGDSLRVTAVVRDAEGAEITDAEVVWSSTDTTVASVGGEGWVVARGNGTASIVARAGEVADTVEVDVEQVAISLVVTPDSAVVGEGDTLQLEAEVVDANGHAIPGETITWSSMGAVIADVDDTGLLTGKRRGSSTTVLAKSAELLDTVSVRVADQIVFANDDGEIYRINDDGSGERLLVPSGGRNPVWSPNGDKIAYEVVSGEAASDIWVMDADGSGKQRLTTSGKASSPSWSPDSRKIAYRDQPSGASVGTIHLMNADGTGKAKLWVNTTFEEYDPVWSPTGDRIAFRSVVIMVAATEIFVVNTDGTGEVRLTNNSAEERYVTWSPDGKKIAYQIDVGGKDRINVVDLETNTTEALFAVPGSYNWSFPQWSPDGSMIMLHSDQFGDPQIVTVTPDGMNSNWNGLHPGVPSRFGKWSPGGQRSLYRVGDKHLYTQRSGERPVWITAKADAGDSPQHAWRPRPVIFIPPIFP